MVSMVKISIKGISLEGLSEPIKTYIKRKFPEQSGVPDDFERMISTAKAHAEKDASNMRMDLSAKLLSMPDRERVKYRAKREKEIQEFIDERIKYYLDREIELYKIRHTGK
jgi:hypothetical protein